MRANSDYNKVKEAVDFLSLDGDDTETENGEISEIEQIASVPLVNAKAENFARNLAAGVSQKQSYLKAYGKPNAGYASKKAREPLVAARISWLKKEARSKSAYTKDNMRTQLGELIAIASARYVANKEAKPSEMTAITSALKLMCQLEGHLVETNRIEMTIDQLFEAQEISTLSDDEAAGIKDTMKAAVVRSLGKALN